MTLPSNGVYRIAPFKNINQVAEVSARSQSEGAYLIVHSKNGGDPAGNFEKVYYTSSNGKMRFLHSLKMADVKNNGIANGTPVIQHSINDDSESQQFTLTEDTGRTASINGESMHPFKIAKYSTSGAVIDAAQGSTSNGTQLQIYASNDTDAQRWFLIPEAYYISTNPVPSNVGIATSVYGDIYSSLNVNNQTSLYPAWVCNWDKFQLRYRVRGRIKSSASTTWTDWTLWKSPTGLTSHDGWGNVWDDNCTPTSSKAYRWATAITPTLDWQTHDAYEVQIQVRSWKDGALDVYENPTVSVGGSGSSCTSSVMLFYSPSFTVGDISFTPDGLSIPYTSDWVKGYEYISVEYITDSNGHDLCSKFIEYNAGQNGTIDIPIESMCSIPLDGDSVTVKLSVGTSYTTVDVTANCDIEYSGISGEFTIAQSVSDDVNTISISGSFSNERLYLSYMNNGILRIEETSKNVLPPFNSPYQIIAFAKDSGDWSMAKVDGETVNSRHCSWDTPEESVKLRIFQSRYGNSSYKYSRDSEFFATNGIDTERGFQGSSYQCDIDVDGVVLLGSLSAFERIKVLNKPLFRSADGKRCRVIVTDVENETVANGHVAVSVKQKECV